MSIFKKITQRLVAITASITIASTLMVGPMAIQAHANPIASLPLLSDGPAPGPGGGGMGGFWSQFGQCMAYWSCG